MPFYNDPGVRRDPSSSYYDRDVKKDWKRRGKPGAGQVRNPRPLGFLELGIPGQPGFMGGALPRTVANTTRPSKSIPPAPVPPAPSRGGGGNNWMKQYLANQEAANRRSEKQYAAQQRQNQAYERESAYDYFADMGKNWGLDGGEIGNALRGLGPMDYQNPTKIVDAIRGTNSWKERFGGVMNARKKNGLNYLTEGEIIAKENHFQELLNPLGLGQGKVANYVADWVGSGTSPQEIGDRVALAEEWVDGQDKGTLKWMRENYGVDKKQLVGYVLDNKGDRSVTWFADQQKAAQIGGDAAGYGIDVGKKYANKLVDKDIGREEARDAFEYADQSKGNINKLAGLSGEDKISKRDLANSQLQGVSNKKSKQTKEKVRRLRSEERARWGGAAAGAGREQFGQPTNGAGGL